MTKPAPIQPDLFLTRSLSGISSLRDDVDIMSHPFLALEKGRTKPMEFETREGAMRARIRVTGADYGIASQWDNDPLIYLRTAVIAAINAGEPVNRRMRFPVYDFLKTTKRGTSGRSYEHFNGTLQRLKATSIITNISNNGWTKDLGVSWIDSYEFITKPTSKGDIMAGCEVLVSEWAFAMMTDAKRALTVDPAYFDLSGALERKLYGIVRKHCGNQRVWWIGVEKLRDLCGSTREVYKFRHELRKIVERQSIPGYVLELSDRTPDIGGVKLPPALVSPPATSRMNFLVVRPAVKLIGM